MPRVNVPTILARAATLLQYVCHETSALPPGVQRVDARTLVRGRLKIQLQDAPRLLELAPQRSRHLLRMLPHVWVACFALARRDYLAGQLDGGRLALVGKRADGTPGTLRRLAREVGADPDNPGQLQDVRACVYLLERLTVTERRERKRGRKTSVSYVTYRALRVLEDAQTFRGADLDGGRYRGGSWIVAQIPPELHGQVTNQFLQLPSRLLELGHREFVGALTILAQHAYRRHKAGRITLDQERLLVETGAHDAGRPGRALAYLSRCIAALVRVGYVVSASVDRGRRWLLELVEPETLAEPAPGACTFGRDGPPGPETLAERAQKAQGFQALKRVIQDLVTSSVRGCEYVSPPSAARGGGLMEGKGARREPG